MVVLNYLWISGLNQGLRYGKFHQGLLNEGKSYEEIS